jgi:hypothetical protein
MPEDDAQNIEILEDGAQDAANEHDQGLPERVWNMVTAPVRWIAETVADSSGAPIARPGLMVDPGVTDLANLERNKDRSTDNG